ncbi:MAG: hypothetical protein P8Y71_24935 [Pseudolabrys sp.]
MAGISGRISQTLATAVLLAAGMAVVGASSWAEAAHERKPADAAATGKPSPRNVFQAFVEGSLERTLMRPILRLFAKREYGAAERALRALAEKFPQSSLYRYNLAAAQARLGMTNAALDNLKTAIDLGFSNKTVFERDPDLESLRGRPRFKTLLAKVDAVAAAKAAQAKVPPSPARVVGRRARVEKSNTRLEGGGAFLVSRFEFPPKPSSNTVHIGKKPFAVRLNDLFRAGKAAGDHGDLYDNRDRGHSDFGWNVMPQVSHIEYGAAAKAVGLDYGVNPGFLFNSITFGNSSTAITHGLAWRSDARLILTTPNLILAAYLQYLNNHVYVYPAHHDHDSGNGDRRAHPSVFSAKEIDLSKLVNLANGLNADEVPPPVHLAVVEDDKVRPGIDYFGPPAMNETLFDTPGAIARIVRSSHYWNRLVVSAEKTHDPNGRPLRFRWVVLSGDADRIKIKRGDTRTLA